jgi:hypothetical protein
LGEQLTFITKMNDDLRREVGACGVLDVTSDSLEIVSGTGGEN